MWDLIVSVPDHCLSFYFVRFFSDHFKPQIQTYVLFSAIVWYAEKMGAMLYGELKG